MLCLWGELGAGKTVFAKGFGAGLGVRDTISSPSFVLMGEYAGRLPLFHIDLYRLATAAEAFDGGLLDDRQATGVVAHRVAGSARRERPRRAPRRPDRRRSGRAAPAPPGGPRLEPPAATSRPAVAAEPARERDPSLAARRSTRRRTRSSWPPARLTARVLGHETFEGRYRHSQELLPAVARLVERRGPPARATSRGSSSARAPGRSRACGSASRRRRPWPTSSPCPIVGIATSDALLAGRAGRDGPVAAVRPARSRRDHRRRASRAIVHEGEAAAWSDAAARPADDVAVDLDGRATPDARWRAAARRWRGCRRHCSASARLGSPPATRTIPSGWSRATRARRAAHRSSRADGGVAWSRDPR